MDLASLVLEPETLSVHSSNTVGNRDLQNNHVAMLTAVTVRLGGETFRSEKHDPLGFYIEYSIMTSFH